MNNWRSIHRVLRPSPSSSATSTSSQCIMSFFSVSKSPPELVMPSEPTPSGNLRLAWLDRYPTQGGLIGSLYVFSQGHEPASVVRAALAKALVFYYPFAGRLVFSEQGERQVSCSPEGGVWFIEASADCNLAVVGGLEHPPSEAEELLLPHPLPGVDPFEESKYLLMLQVTTFTCGGFVVGLRMNHTITDGLGAGQLLLAIGDMARGLDKPTVKPLWWRETVPEPSKQPNFGPPPIFVDMKVQHLIVDIPLNYINLQKSKYNEETGLHCSAFDLVIAKTWQCRTQAIKLDPEAEVHLCFSMNTRQFLKGVLPAEGCGYYGNCYYNMRVSARSGEITNATVAEVVKLIREAKGRLVDEWERFMKGEMEQDPYLVVPGYESLAVSDWSRLGLNEVDYGWGTPVHAVPLMDMVCFPLCVVVKPPQPKQGARLIVKCVNKDHFAEFSKLMMMMT